MRHFLLSLSLGIVLLSAGRTSALDGCLWNTPCPELSDVPDVIPVSPDGTLTYRVVIVTPGGPQSGATIEMRLTSAGDTLVCWCSAVTGPRPHKFFQTTDANGIADFNLTAGGCIELGNSGIPGPVDYVAEVFADGVKMAECGMVSPDVVDANGRKAVQSPVNWSPAGVCGVSVGDAVFHTSPLSGGPPAYDYCTDMDGDGVAGTIDAVILTPYLAGAVSCPGDAGP